MAYGQKSKKNYRPEDYTIAGVDLSPHMMDLGADYLRVPGRLLWFRAVHPAGAILTELVQLDLAAGFAMFKAEVTNADGQLLATGYGSETAKGFAGGYIEKAETISIGRALAAAGFGTQFAAADYTDHEGKLADAPTGRPSRTDTLPDDAVVTTQKTKGPRALVSEGQRKSIKSEAIRAGWTREKLAKHLADHYDVERTTDLTGEEAARLLTDLNACPEAEPEFRAHAEASFEAPAQKAS